MDDDGPQQVGYFDWLSYKEGDPLERGQGWCGGPDSEIMTKLRIVTTAGVMLKQMEDKTLIINGRSQKVDHLVNVMQRLHPVLWPSPNIT
ncbi:predicted protein [Lichtheimia corymbifera JMRC:FSU:9682]|uniref:Uncharacterized protein n=1 Tax=Lichtheimia corymbifera JMRC:FSU:9682 TaxID=1263082 RepID=A0A068RXM9_9FUNG|nr:predicted protein [Lichtheimia corymbifera JMRC:FSU:9682]